MTPISGFIIAGQVLSDDRFDKLYLELDDQGYLLASAGKIYEVWGCEECQIYLSLPDQVKVTTIFDKYMLVSKVEFVLDFDKYWNGELQ